jgi:hypothetical protein
VRANLEHVARVEMAHEVVKRAPIAHVDAGRGRRDAEIGYARLDAGPLGVDSFRYFV